MTQANEHPSLVTPAWLAAHRDDRDTVNREADHHEPRQPIELTAPPIDRRGLRGHECMFGVHDITVWAR